MSVFNFPQFEDEYDGYKMRVLVDEVIRQFQAIQQEAPAAGGGGGGTTDHGLLTGRSNVDQHPIAAITGLQAALNAKANQVDLAALTLVVNSNTNAIIALQIDLAAHLVDFLNPHNVTLQQTYDEVTAPPQININATPDPLTVDATVVGDIFAVRDDSNVDVLRVATTGILGLHRAVEFLPQTANPAATPANAFYMDDGTNFDANTVAMGDLTVPMLLTGNVGFGDPGTEQGGIDVGGVNFDATVKVNDFGGTVDAMLVLHRHSTSFGSNLVFSRTNSDTSAHVAVAPGQVISQMVNVGWSGTHYDINSIQQTVVPLGTTVSATSLAGQVEFYTTPDLSNTALLTLLLGSDQSVEISGAYTLPTADGLDRQIMVTDGAGTLIFEDQGTTAGLLSAEYRFSTTTTAADPGAGRFRFDTAAYATVTEIFIDILTDNGADITNLLAQISIGDRLYFQNRTDAAKFVAFDVIADAVDNTGWFTIGVNAIAEGTFLGNNDRSIFIWSIDGGSSPQRLEYEAMSTRSLVNSDFTIGSTIAEGVQAVSAGTGATVFSPSAIQDDHPGIWGLRTGSTAAGRVFIIGRVGSYNIGVGGITRVGTWVQTPATLSDAVQEYVLRSGLFSISLPNTIDFGVGFEYQFDQNGGRWQGITDATAESSVDTGVTVVVDTWYFLELEVNAAGTSVEFFIDQVSVGTLAVAANIPQGTGFNNFYNTHIMKLTGTTARDFFVDAYYTYQELTR